MTEMDADVDLYCITVNKIPSKPHTTTSQSTGVLTFVGAVESTTNLLKNGT